MSSGGGYQGGRTRMGTKIFLNLYDLTPANDFLYPIGFGLHHSGVEILGSEYSFASGGGIFEATPKEAPGAIFREQIELGIFQGGSSDVRTVISDMRQDWAPDSYNLVRKNCNHFANALCWALLNRTIPAHVNRLADIGVCCSCLLPKKLLEEAPVGDPNASSTSGSSGGYQVFGGTGRSSSSADRAPPRAAFSGTGAKLGSDDSEGGIGMSMFSSVGGSANKGKDDLTDRREKARKAALARLERKNDSTGDSSAEKSK